jgi:hypothetical protein
MRSGSLAASDVPQAKDHPVVARLRAAGTVVVGVTNLPELGIYPFTDSGFGIARNPWDRRRTPGGSVTGAAGHRAGSPGCACLALACAMSRAPAGTADVRTLLSRRVFECKVRFLYAKKKVFVILGLKLPAGRLWPAKVVTL